MAHGKYIGSEDVAEIKATIVQMLAAGTPRSEIVTALAARYVPHDDLARLVARVPTADDARRYKPVRIILMALGMVYLIFYIVLLIVLLIAFIRNPTVILFGTCFFPCMCSLAVIGMTGFTLASLRRDDGLAYELGCFTGFVIMCDSLSGLAGGWIAAVFGLMAVVGAGICIVSLVLWRKFFPDIRLINPPPKDATGAYVFKRDTPVP
ncbi:MAG: hypothetical protein NTV22_09680 [bacterium]|nr:hypothetical protein [bacterium]